MKKILILANNDVGLYKFRKEIIEELLKENEVYISLPYGKLVDKLISMGCKFIDTPVDRRGINPLTDLKLLNSYRKLFNKIKPDLAITYTIKPNIYASLIARFKKIDYAVNITGLGTAFQSDNLLRKLIVFLYKIALKKVKVVFFENEENQNIFINEHIVSRDKTCKLNGAGVNLEDYPYNEYPDENQDIRFLFIGASLIARFKKIDYAVNITGLGTAFQSDNLLRKLIVFLYKIALKKVKVVFFENEENQNIFINEHIVSRDKTCKLNGAGVNLEDYPYNEYPDENQDIRFLFIGRIMKEKGIDELLDAAGRIKKDYPTVQFDIVGPMEDNYKETIDEYVNNDVINYYGFQSDVKPFIKQCHCFILPSYHEGMANTLLESASMGRPLITSNISGCKEAINNNGYLVKVKNSDDLYLKIKEFIALDYQDKVILSKNSRKHIEEVFDKRKVVKETMKGLGL